MSDTLKLALTITAVDMFSGVMRRLRDRVKGTGKEAQRVRKDFDDMERSINRGVKALAVAGYVAAKLRPGVRAASDLQAEMLGAKAEMSGAGTNAAVLAKQLVAVRDTAFQVQAWTPFDMTQIVAMEKELIKAGARVQDIVGKSGAAAATAALATYEKLDPTQIGNALVGIGTPFKVQASGYMKLADDISRAASASTVGAADIAESAKYAAGPLAALRKTPKEMLALVAVMAQVGVTGSMAGTSLRRFFMMAARHKVFRQANGDLKSTVEIIDILHQKLDGKGAAEQSAILNKVFGPEGAPVALALLNKGKGSFSDIIQQMDQAAPLAKKLGIQMEGFGKQMESLSGTSKSTIATLFQPALNPLTKLVKKTNEWVAALGTAAQHQSAIGKTVTYGGGALVGAGLLYGGYKLLRGGLSGMRVLKGLKGLGGGVAAGKALEATAGVTPVYVVNMPAGGIAGGIGDALGSGGKRASVLSRMGGLIKRGGSGLAALGGGGAGGAALAGGAVVASGAAGYGAGTVIYNKAISGTKLGDAIGSGIAHVLAWFGNKDARQAIADTAAGERHARDLKGTIKLEVESKNATVKVHRMQTDHPGVNLQTDTGLATAGGW